MARYDMTEYNMNTANENKKMKLKKIAEKNYFIFYKLTCQDETLVGWYYNEIKKNNIMIRTAHMPNITFM